MHVDGRELLALERTEVECQRHDESTILLKIGHKGQGIVRFVVTAADKHLFRVQLADVWLPASFDVSALVSAAA